MKKIEAKRDYFRCITPCGGGCEFSALSTGADDWELENLDGHPCLSTKWEKVEKK